VREHIRPSLQRDQETIENTTKIAVDVDVFHAEDAVAQLPQIVFARLIGGKFFRSAVGITIHFDNKCSGAAQEIHGVGSDPELPVESIALEGTLSKSTPQLCFRGGEIAAKVAGEMEVCLAVHALLLPYGRKTTLDSVAKSAPIRPSGTFPSKAGEGCVASLPQLVGGAVRRTEGGGGRQSKKGGSL
jgi:hypothetical protein